MHRWIDIKQQRIFVWSCAQEYNAYQWIKLPLSDLWPIWNFIYILMYKIINTKCMTFVLLSVVFNEEKQNSVQGVLQGLHL